jgi:hypothetical protein
MKKIFAGLGVAAMLLAGCSSSSSTSTDETTNYATVTTDSGEVTAGVTKTDGKVTGITIDETSDGESKKDLGDDYGMKAASGIGKEWDEQIEFLENYLLENGIDSVKLDSDGYAESEDVLAGCTINLTNIMKAVDEAAEK